MTKWYVDYLRIIASIIIFLWFLFSVFAIPMLTTKALVSEIIIGRTAVIIFFLWFLYLPFIGILMKFCINSKFLNNN